MYWVSVSSPSFRRASAETAGTPFTSTLPDSGAINPAASLMAVVLPAPLGPTSPRAVPPGTSMSSSRTMVFRRIQNPSRTAKLALFH